MPLSRRELLTAILGLTAASMTGCNRAQLSSLNTDDPGVLLSPNFSLGHRLRDQDGAASPNRIYNIGRPEKTRVLIVGGGIAGLSAAWQLSRQRIDDFIILELEQEVGGTARSGRTGAVQHPGSIKYPWGAHYVPVPMAENRSLISLFEEMGVITGSTSDGHPVVAEQYLCRQPQERVYFQGQWHEGLYPAQGASREDDEQLQRFQSLIARWADRRDDAGRRLFAIPISAASTDLALAALDHQTMADWMDSHRLTSERLRWLVDYSCLDDYGVDASRASAWAGLFYFAARLRSGSSSSQEVMTWPEGNGRIAKYLADRVGDRIRKGKAALSIQSNADVGALATVIDGRTSAIRSIQADRVIFAAPQFIAKHVITDWEPHRKQAADSFRYGSWLVANVHLIDRPIESSFPISWDNVIYGSRSLGYVTATHQTGRDHGETVLTWYYPLSAADPTLSRQKLLALGWQDWADVVLADLQIPHPDIAPLIRKIDFMRWGHAMVTPGVGSHTSPARSMAASPNGRVHFAGSDLSGVALMEEAFDHGIRAADEVTEALNRA